MANKPQACPKCGKRLFYYTSEGKFCSSCGFQVEREEPSIDDSNEIDNLSAPTALCPVCGSMGTFSGNDESGVAWYDCRTCLNHYKDTPRKTWQPKPKPAPEAKSQEEEKDPNRPMSGKEIFDMAKKCTVETRKWFIKQKGYIAGASGFFITGDLILTCAHCATEGDVDDGNDKVLSNNKLEARYKGGEYFPVTLLYFDCKHDLALLKSSNVCPRPSIIAKENAKTGEDIYSVGNSDNQGMCIMQGIVSDELRTVGKVKREMMMNSANTVGGNSGCPTFNDKGEVVGVHTSGDPKAVAMKYDAPVTRIRSFLQDAEKKLGITIKLK